MYCNQEQSANYLGNSSGISGLGAIDSAKAEQIFNSEWNKLSSGQKQEMILQALQGKTKPLLDMLTRVGVQFCKSGLKEAFKDWVNNKSQKMFHKNIFKK